MSDTKDFLSVRSVSKQFKIGSSVIKVLRGVSFNAGRGEWTVLLGANLLTAMPTFLVVAADIICLDCRSGNIFSFIKAST